MKKNRILYLIVVFCFFTKLTSALNGDTLTINPNPFDSVTVIHFQIANNDTISLTIYNAFGQTIKTYFNNTVLPSGSYSFNFNGDTLPNGIYFAHLKIGSVKTIASKLIKVSKAVSVNESFLFQNIVMYPNPTNSIVNIIDEHNKFQNSTIEIKNNLGQVVFRSSFTNQINLHNLSLGIYFLTIQDKHYKKTVKIIKE